MSLQRAYSLVVFKSVDDEQRIIEGVASTPALDRQGDVLLPEGAEYSLPHPLLLNHNQDRPIGHVLTATVTPKGIRIRAQIAKGVAPFIEEAWQLIRAGLIRGLSVGAQLKDVERIATGLRAKTWSWLETSAVVIPANQQASILMVKSLDAASLAVSGERVRSTPKLPGVSGQTTGSKMHKTISEQLTEARADMAEQQARYQELLEQESNESGLTKDAEVERDTLTKSLSDLSGRVERLAVLEKSMVQAGTLTVVPQRQQQTEKPKVEVVELEKGIRFARVAMAIGMGRGSVSDTLEYAKRWNGQTPEVSKFIKEMLTKAVAGSTVAESPGWGSELVYANNVVGEFIELLRARTIMDRIKGFRSGVFNTRMVAQTDSSTVNWVGEGDVKPVTELDFDTVTLPFHKIAGIVVMTQELARLSTPSAERAVRDDLVKQIARFKDAQFLLSSVTATADRPAAVTNGVSSPAASGTDADALYADLNTALATFDNNENAETLYILMTPALARGISTLRNTMGGMEFPTMTPAGGSLLGYPVIASSSVPSGTIVILNPGDILVADDGSVSLDASTQATLDLAGGSSPNVNLWQRNLIAIRAELAVTWKKVRAESVAIIDTASYGPTGS